MSSPGRRSLPQGAEKVTAVRAMFDTIAPRYDLVNRVMTFRMDVGWRRAAVAALDLAPGSVVLDLASGTGDLCHDLERTGLRPLAADLSLGMLRHATHTHPRVQADAVRLPMPAACMDGAVCGFALRNFVSLPPVFAELSRVVRPGGRIALLDVAQPDNPVLRVGHSLYFGRVVPLIGGVLSDRPAYSYLPRSVAYLPEPRVMLDELRAAGFVALERRLLAAGLSQLVTASRAHP